MIATKTVGRGGMMMLSSTFCALVSLIEVIDLRVDEKRRLWKSPSDFMSFKQSKAFNSMSKPSDQNSPSQCIGFSKLGNL
jgi:hypothetical protein